MSTTRKVFFATPLFPKLPDTHRSELGEGPVWDHRQNRLTWVDITQATLHVFDATTNEHTSHVLPTTANSSENNSEATTTSANSSSSSFPAPPPRCLSFAIPCEGDAESLNAFVCGSDTSLFLWSPPIFESSSHAHCNDATHRHSAPKNTLQFLERVISSGDGNANNKKSANNVRANDAKIDPYGRLFWGTMDIGEKAPVGALFCRDPEKARVSQRIIGGCTISNGIDWSPSFDVMYFVDSTTGCVFEVPYRPEAGYMGGGGSNSSVTLLEAAHDKNMSTRIVYRAPAGMFPDGICVDEVGCLWIALYGGGKVVRIDPKQQTTQNEADGGNTDGVVIAEVLIPDAPCVTSLCFGGPRLSQLFITTARDKRRTKQATNNDAGGGHVFTANVGVCGQPFHPYQRNRDAAATAAAAHRTPSHL